MKLSRKTLRHPDPQTPSMSQGGRSLERVASPKYEPSAVALSNHQQLAPLKSQRESLFDFTSTLTLRIYESTEYVEGNACSADYDVITLRISSAIHSSARVATSAGGSTYLWHDISGHDMQRLSGLGHDAIRTAQFERLFTCWHAHSQYQLLQPSRKVMYTVFAYRESAGCEAELGDGGEPQPYLMQ